MISDAARDVVNALQEIVETADSIGPLNQAISEKKSELTAIESTLTELSGEVKYLSLEKDEAIKLIDQSTREADAIRYAAERYYQTQVDQARKDAEVVRQQYRDDIDRLRKSMRGAEKEFDERVQRVLSAADVGDVGQIRLVNEEAFLSMDELVIKGVNNGKN